MVVEIDGSVLEGGGQILRSAIAFSAVLQESVLVKNIRAKRSNPGLRPQHLHGILALKQITEADVKGTHVGSKEISFQPHHRRGGELTVNIGTAGSITLILQAVMVVAPFCDNPVTSQIVGGTNVAWSPPIDYLQHVFLPRLKQMGYSGMIKIENRGYYPRGGGRVQAVFRPLKLLSAIQLEESESKPQIMGLSHSGSLPKHVAERQALAASKILKDANYDHVNIEIEHNPRTMCPGSGISLWTMNDVNRLIGSDALGRRGLRAEKVGQNSAEQLIKELRTGAPIDRHQADMIIPYVAVAQGVSSFPISELTLHTITNIHIVEQFLDVKFQVDGELGSPAKIKVQGVGFEGSLASFESAPTG